MEDQLDARVVKAVRSLRTKRTEDSHTSTRTNTPLTDSQLLSNREDVIGIVKEFGMSIEELCRVVSSDGVILQELRTGLPISNEIQRRIIQKSEAYLSSMKIDRAKSSISAKIQERMDALQLKLNRN